MEDIIGKETLEIMGNAQNYNNWLFELVNPWLKGEVAEVGAGMGVFAQKIAAAGNRVTAMDINPGYLALLQQKMPEVQTFEFDLQAKSIPAKIDGAFDTVIAINVLEHVANLNLALKHIYRMLKPKGKLVILIPAFQFAFGELDINLGHYRRFNKKQMDIHLKQVGLKTVFQRYINFWGLWGWWLNSRILKRKIISSSQIKLFDKVVTPWLLLEKFMPLPLGLSLVCVAEKK